MIQPAGVEMNWIFKRLKGVFNFHLVIEWLVVPDHLHFSSCLPASTIRC